jgi:hypothetical protein
MGLQRRTHLEVRRSGGEGHNADEHHASKCPYEGRFIDNVEDADEEEVREQRKEGVADVDEEDVSPLYDVVSRMTQDLKGSMFSDEPDRVHLVKPT